jgi:hypothetical protein
MAIVKENVFRLDVAMNDVMTMRITQRASHFVRDAERIVDWKLPLAIQPRAQ